MVELAPYPAYGTEEMIARSEAFRREIGRRRSVRDFSDSPVPREVIEQCLLAAGSAPSGANQQPWHFVVVSDPATKAKIRVAAEQEEHEFYTARAPRAWLDAIAPLGVNEQKPFLEIAPCLIVIFRKAHDVSPTGATIKNYYSNESVGIATGILITALHHCGLATLTHTPSPMKFLNQILNRPANERPYLILVVGHPAATAQVPDIQRKTLDQIATFV
jgi:nitroreductase